MMLNLIFAAILAIVLLTTPAPADDFSWRTYNPSVTQETIQTTICTPGWTATVRPPVYITNLAKRRLLEAQGMTWERAKDFELDHQIPLCLGGEPGDLDHTSNYQLQPWPEAHRKDRLEAQAARCVCAGLVTLDEARADLEDWQKAYGKYARMTCRKAFK